MRLLTRLTLATLLAASPMLTLAEEEVIDLQEHEVGVRDVLDERRLHAPREGHAAADRRVAGGKGGAMVFGAEQRDRRTRLGQPVSVDEIDVRQHRQRARPHVADEAWAAFAPGELKVFVDGVPLAC